MPKKQSQPTSTESMNPFPCATPDCPGGRLFFGVNGLPPYQPYDDIQLCPSCRRNPAVGAVVAREAVRLGELASVVSVEKATSYKNKTLERKMEGKQI